MGGGADSGLLLKENMTTAMQVRVSVIYTGLRVVDRTIKAAANQLIHAQVCRATFMYLILD
jgi:hypothetical protein